ncbi:MAG: TolC family protein, partial [bacterium]|nr:TolC family protein [bacterium]
MHKSMRTTLLASTLKRGNHRLSGVLTFNLLGLLLLFLSSHMIFAQELDQTNVKTSEESFDMWDAINAIRARVVQRQGEAPPVEAPVVEATEEETPAVEEEVAAETTARKSTIRERVKTIWRRFRGQPEPSVPVPAKRRPIPLPRVRRARTGEIRPDPSGLVELKLIDFIALVREKNNRIIYQRYEWQISSEAVKRERSIFEPELAASFQVEKNDVPNTTQESMSLGFISNFREQNKRYNTSLTWLEPSGGRIGLEYRLSDLRNNLQAQVIDREWKDFLGVTYTHPLLKNRGVGITKAKINIAIKDREMKFQAYRQEMMKIVAVSASAYYELYMAQDKVKMRQESVRIAEKVLNTNHEWVKAGRMPKTEILEAEAGLDIRKSLQSQAKQDLVVAMNTVRSLLLASVTEATTTFVAS